jgi:hypothetical protein
MPSERPSFIAYFEIKRAMLLPESGPPLRLSQIQQESAPGNFFRTSSQRSNACFAGAPEEEAFEPFLLFRELQSSIL